LEAYFWGETEAIKHVHIPGNVRHLLIVALL
jgi:hypothetical protein